MARSRRPSRAPCAWAAPIAGSTAAAVAMLVATRRVSSTLFHSPAFSSAASNPLLRRHKCRRFPSFGPLFGSEFSDGSRRWRSGRSAGEEGLSGIASALDPRTVDLHKSYHDKTIEYTMEHMEWVQSKAYGIDGELTSEKQDLVQKAARARFRRWPRLDERDMHDVPLGPSPQRFCQRYAGDSAADLGDPAENVFIISLPRRPTKLKHALFQLHEQGVSAKIVDAVDGDAILCKSDVKRHGVEPIPGYAGHSNHKIHLSTGEVGCFMSHYTIWQHMLDNNIPSALILEDDFDMQEDFARRLGEYLEEAEGEDWNLMYVGRSPVEPDYRRVSDHIVEPGYTLWTVGYIIRLEAAKALLDARVERCMAPLDDYFSVAMGRYTLVYNEFAMEWSTYVPRVFRPLAMTPPLVMPYVGSMFLSDTAMLRKGTRYVKDLPEEVADEKVWY